MCIHEWDRHEKDLQNLIDQGSVHRLELNKEKFSAELLNLLSLVLHA